MAAPGAQAFVPDTSELDRLAEAARTCHGCDLYLNASQTWSSPRIRRQYFAGPPKSGPTTSTPWSPICGSPRGYYPAESQWEGGPHA